LIGRKSPDGAFGGPTEQLFDLAGKMRRLDAASVPITSAAEHFKTRLAQGLLPSVWGLGRGHEAFVTPPALCGARDDQFHRIPAPAATSPPRSVMVTGAAG
jgi:hypothetical protein